VLSLCSLDKFKRKTCLKYTNSATCIVSTMNPQQKRKDDSMPTGVKRVRVAKPGPRSAFCATSSASSSSSSSRPQRPSEEIDKHVFSSILTLKDASGPHSSHQRVHIKHKKDNGSSTPTFSSQFNESQQSNTNRNSQFSSINSDPYDIDNDAQLGLSDSVPFDNLDSEPLTRKSLSESATTRTL
jgi:hypothetical protein